MFVLSETSGLGGSKKVMVSEIQEMVTGGRGVVLFKLNLVLLVLINNMIQWVLFLK